MGSAKTSAALRALACAVALTIAVGSAFAAPLLKVKAIYVDLDGTALDSTRHVRPATIDALHEFRRRGGHVGIATGRTRGQADEAIRAIEPDLPVIVYNGAALARGSEPLRVLGHLDSASVGIARRVFGEAAGVQGFIVYYPNRAVPDRDSPEIRAYATKQSLELAAAGETDGDPIKILALCASKDVVASLQARLRAEIGAHAQVVNSSGMVLDVVPEGIDKLHGIREALRGTSIRLEDVLAFGDGENDVEMLSGVGFGAAMSNCVPRTCEAADVIVGANTGDAIARFVRTFVLGLPSVPVRP